MDGGALGLSAVDSESMDPLASAAQLLSDLTSHHPYYDARSDNEIQQQNRTKASTSRSSTTAAQRTGRVHTNKDTHTRISKIVQPPQRTAHYSQQTTKKHGK